MPRVCGQRPTTRDQRPFGPIAGIEISLTQFRNVLQVEQYRRTYQVTDRERALGPEPHTPGQRADRHRVRTAIELDPDPALAGRRHPRHRGRWGSPWPPARTPARPGGWRARGRGSRLGLRFRPSPDAIAWQRGAAGERRTARLLGHLERHGWAVLHDLAVPGSPANLDHLVIGPGGVFVVDSKQYRGRLQLDPSGRLWHGRYPLPTLRAVEFEADQAAQLLADSQVVVPIMPARRLPSMFDALPVVLWPERVADLADRARVRFHAAA